MIPFSGGRQLSNGRRTGLGSGFGGVVSYLMEGRREDLALVADAGDRVAWTSTRNLPVDEPQQAALWMRAWANQNPRVREPVYHFGASLAPDESLTREQWEHVADRMLERLGLEDHQAFIALHRDRDHEHVHIAANRVGPDLRVWKPSYDVFKQQDAARELERELGLRVVPTRRDLRRGYREANPVRLERREIEKPFAPRVARAALEDFRQAASWGDREARLARRGLRLELAKRGGGVNVSDGRERAGIARIDRSLSGPRLARRFGETLRQYRKRHPDRPRLERPFGRPLTESDLPIEARAENLVRHLAAQRATWTEEDVRRLSDRDLDGDALLRQALASDQIVSVGTGPRSEVRFAAAEYLEAEAGMFTAAGRLARRSDFRLSQKRVGALLEERFTELSREQRRAVVHATTQEDLALIVGRAGAGKTRLTRAVVAAYREDGRRVLGAALAGKAAEGLAAEAGIEASTLASYEASWQRGFDELSSQDVLLIDEAGMVDVRQMGRVLEHARARGAKVVLVGDPDQLKAIGAGDAFRGLIERHGAARVDTIRRQADAWQRTASEHVADGRLAPALSAYRERGGIQWHTRRDEAKDALVMAYFEDRYLAPDQSSLILAYRNADVRNLNDRIRELRRGAGELGPSVRVNAREFSVGDRVLFLRNDHCGREVRTVEGEGHGVKNGALGTLLKAEPHRLEIRLDSGRTVELDPRAYHRLAHGYAATVHKSQGATVDRAYVLADRGFDRNLAYVALTRHRHQLRLYVDEETFDSAEQLERVLAREPRKDLVRDYRPASIEAGTPGAEPTATEPVLGAARSPNERPVEVTPERLGRLEAALRRLDRWDEISARAGAVGTARSELAYCGNLHDLRQAVAELERPMRHLDHDLERIYRRPELGRAAFERHARDHGAAAAFRRLGEAPESFGRLKGGRVVSRSSQARAEALRTARRLGSRGLEREAQLTELRETLEVADRYRALSLELTGAQERLAGGRDELVAELRLKAVGLDLGELEGRLPARHLETLRNLELADRRQLEPLRGALDAFRRARRDRRPRAGLLRLARQLSALYRATPASLLRRLAPPQLRLLMSAVSLAAAALEKLSGERKDKDRARKLLFS